MIVLNQHRNGSKSVTETDTHMLYEHGGISIKSSNLLMSSTCSQVDLKRFYHRVGGPAIEAFQKSDGKKTFEYWSVENAAHRSSGPAMIAESDDAYEEEWYSEGHLDRKGGPSRVSIKKDKVLYEHFYKKALHRKNGPATFEMSIDHGTAKLFMGWYVNGRMQNGAGPSKVSLCRTDKYTSMELSWSKGGNLNRSNDEYEEWEPLPNHYTYIKNHIDNFYTISCSFDDKKDSIYFGPKYFIANVFCDTSAFEIKSQDYGSRYRKANDISKLERYPEHMQQKALFGINRLADDYYTLFGIEHLIADFQKAREYSESYYGEFFYEKFGFSS